MKFGTSLPILAADIAGVRDYVQALDREGFDYLTLAGHVISNPPDRYEGRPPATFAGPYYDPFVLFSYLAGITSHIEFVTSILILPLFQTVLVAKQAAELSHVSGNRFRMGVGISWQEAEYEAMGQDLHTRGKRLEEQVEVLRLLWTKPFVTFDGRWHKLDNVGIGRLPSKPIPIWFGSQAEEPQLRRAARLGDGWMPMGNPTEKFLEIRGYVKEAGRNPDEFELSASVSATEAGPDAWIEEAKRLQALGATHLTLSTPPELKGGDALSRLLELRKTLTGAL